VNIRRWLKRRLCRHHNAAIEFNPEHYFPHWEFKCYDCGYERDLS